MPLLDLERGEGLKVGFDVHSHSRVGFLSASEAMPALDPEGDCPTFPFTEDITPEQTSVLLHTCTKPYCVQAIAGHCE